MTPPVPQPVLSRNGADAREYQFTASDAPRATSPGPWQPLGPLSRPWLTTEGGSVAGEPELTSHSRDVEQLLAERGDQLIRAAIALAGSRAEGEDLLQAAIERPLRRRCRIESDLEGYLRRTLYSL